jgi:hypothetical protein
VPSLLYFHCESQLLLAYVSEAAKGAGMREHLQNRLEQLKHEFQVGEIRLNELEAQQRQLRETMLRIDGAMQVLLELLRNETGAEEVTSADATRLQLRTAAAADNGDGSQ